MKSLKILAIGLIGSLGAMSNVYASSNPPQNAPLAAPLNTAILNNPSLQQVMALGNYSLNLTQAPFFNNVVLFAANINGSTPNTAELFYNQEFTALLKTPAGIAAIRNLQAKGIKVQLAFLGNHQSAGWSCKMNSQGINHLAQEMVTAVNQYGMDGINVDDEYSLCSGNKKSFYALLKAIKTNPQFNGKILSKDLYEDTQYFKGRYNIAALLDQGYEMTYSGASDKFLKKYVHAGMPHNKLSLGVWASKMPQDKVAAASRRIQQHRYAGVMLWWPHDGFASPESAADYFSQIAQGSYGAQAKVRYLGTELAQPYRGAFYPLYNSGVGQWIPPQSNMPFEKLTALYPAFAHIYPQESAALLDFEHSQPHEAANLRELVTTARKVNPQLKIIISIGWGHNDWSYVSNDYLSNSHKFVPSVVAFLRANQLDGLDIDDENLNDSSGMISQATFDQVISDLRLALDAAAREDGRPYYLTISPAGDNLQGNLAKTQISPNNLHNFDMINVQSYFNQKWGQELVSALTQNGYPAGKISLGVNSELPQPIYPDFSGLAGLFEWSLSADSATNYATTQQIYKSVK